ncbi:MAG: hypothetical protein EZS28_053209, partial [Streblomastix strix]
MSHDFWIEQLDAGRSVGEILSGSVYIALIMSRIDIRKAMSEVKEKDGILLSDLQAFEWYVNIMDVLWSSSLREYYSSNTEAITETSNRCVENVANFLIFCDELTRAVLHNEPKRSYRICLQRILNIERNYSEACTNAAIIYMLKIVDIWGREWYPELVQLSKKEKNTNNNNRKRRRINKEEQEKDNNKYQNNDEQQIKTDQEQITEPAIEQQIK